jgi:FkbH-like protein
MTTRKPTLESLLTASSRSELRACLRGLKWRPALAEAQRLANFAAQLDGPRPELRIGVVHTYTSELLDPWFELAGGLQGLDLKIYHAPYGLNLQEALEGSGLRAHRPDITLLLMQREDLHPALRDPVVVLDAKGQDALRTEALDRLLMVLATFREAPIGQILFSLLPSSAAPALGLYDLQSERSEAVWWARLAAEAAERIRAAHPSTLYLDLDQILSKVGRDAFFEPRLWLSARYPFGPAAARELTRQVICVGEILKRPKAKVIVLDADNTLWGGIVGEDGPEGILLGPDYPGSAYVAFQRRLLDFQQRGFILALCSKNNEADVDEILERHPHQRLKAEHFAARRVNWAPKVENIRELAEELNLGLDSFIFIDDSSFECEAVRRELPEVEVIQTPDLPTDVPSCLDEVARLEILSMTDEDRRKTRIYVEEQRRQSLKQSMSEKPGGHRDYLRSLKMVMTVGFDDTKPVRRLAQLTQKTNQFNLTTRRYQETDMRRLIELDNWLVAYFSLADSFGDSGIVGLALAEQIAPDRARLDTYLMSCRVIGRNAEAAFMDAVLKKLSLRGVKLVHAEFVPTAKNALAKNFLPHAGFRRISEGVYERALTEALPDPLSIYMIDVHTG